jgi:hypothetical protein
MVIKLKRVKKVFVANLLIIYCKKLEEKEVQDNIYYFFIYFFSLKRNKIRYCNKLYELRRFP